MEHAQQLPSSFPWRTAAVVTTAIAALELLALVAIVALHLARPLHHTVSAASAPVHRHAATRPAVRLHPVAPAPSQPLRARSQAAVLVLNGNGVQGAARAEAARLQALGYRIGAASNAARHHYARSMVMYVPGYVLEARRLARDARIQVVAPVDGLTPAALGASKLVVLLSS